MYKVFDAHCHIYPDKIAEKASESIGRFYDMPMRYDGRVSTLEKIGERAGVEKYLVQSVATTPHQVRSINEFISLTVNSAPQRYVGFGTLHPDSPDIAGDLEHLKELGLHGVKLHPDVQGFKIDDYRCLKIYELCEKTDTPILMHCGDRRFDNSNPNRLVPILDIYTSLTVIGAHFGVWSVWNENVEKMAGHRNFYVDTSSSFYAISREKAREIIYTYGVDRVLFGTDYPMWDPKEEVERLLALGLSDEENRKILYDNAYNLLCKK